MITADQVRARLQTVLDPELHIDIVSLGLIYDVEVVAGRAKIQMTLTTPGCPLAPVIDKMVQAAIAPLGIGAEVALTWEPPWTPKMMSEEARLMLGVI